MPTIEKIFRKLREFCDPTLTWEAVDELYEAALGPEHDTEDAEANVEPILDMPLIRRALDDPQLTSTMLELCTTIRCLQDPTKSRKQITESWEDLIRILPRDSYLSLIYALCGLAALDATDVRFTRLALVATSTYFLSLTISGAKGFHVFDENVITQALSVFNLLQQVRDPETLQLMKPQQPVEILVNFATIFDDIKLLLSYVKLADCEAVRDELLRRFLTVQYRNYEHGCGNTYTLNLHTKCFEVFERLMSAHHGNLEELFKKILNNTVMLHVHTPLPKFINGLVGQKTDSNSDQHISDFFIRCIPKYPDIMQKLLHFYIECIVTNPVESWRIEDTQRALDYCAKYDAALYSRSQDSCASFLLKAMHADDAGISCRAVELAGRLLLCNSQPQEVLYPADKDAVPRDVHIIKELIDKLRDPRNVVKQKAAIALYMAFVNKPECYNILKDSVRYAMYDDEFDSELPNPPATEKHINFEWPAPIANACRFKGSELLLDAFKHLPRYIYVHLLNNGTFLMRRYGIMLLEQIMSLNPMIIFSTNFVDSITQLAYEPVACVRKQVFYLVDSLLAAYPNCYPVIWIWCKIIGPMLQDADAKLIDLAMEAFCNRVLQNLREHEQTEQQEHHLPWTVFRTLVITQKPLYLQNCFQRSLQPRWLNAKILKAVESHLLKQNSVEAWMLLNLFSGKILSLKPDYWLELLPKPELWNNPYIVYIALEVFATCVHHFSPSALNVVCKFLLEKLRDGNMLPLIIGKSFDFLLIAADHRKKKLQAQALRASRSSSNSNEQPVNEFDSEKWLSDLHMHLEEAVVKEIDTCDCVQRKTSYLYSYTEIILHMGLPPHTSVPAYVLLYIRDNIKKSKSLRSSEDDRTLNAMLQIAGRLALRDTPFASKTCWLYRQVLQEFEQPFIVKNIIVALTDLCKKHTHLVESLMSDMLRKLQSPFVQNRLETFLCFQQLVLEDQLKLRGTLLLALLVVIFDSDHELAMLARHFFREILDKKHKTLFRKCLIECPYVLNEYKNFEGLDSFSGGVIRSPIKGEQNRAQREQLYDYIMADIDDITLVLHFEQLKQLTEKCRQDESMRTEDGKSLLKDVLYIMYRICKQVKQQKVAVDGKEHDAEITLMEKEMADSSSAANTSATAANTTTGGRRRKVQAISMEDALVALEKNLVFISNLHSEIHSWDAKFEEYFDKLGLAMAMRFPQIIQFALPAKFWQKYRDEASAERQKKRKYGHNDSCQSADSNSDELMAVDSDGNEEEALSPPPPKKRRTIDATEANVTTMVIEDE